jgi:hypothetical protein
MNAEKKFNGQRSSSYPPAQRTPEQIQQHLNQFKEVQRKRDQKRVGKEVKNLRQDYSPLDEDDSDSEFSDRV